MYGMTFRHLGTTYHYTVRGVKTSLKKKRGCSRGRGSAPILIKCFTSNGKDLCLWRKREWFWSSSPVYNLLLSWTLRPKQTSYNKDDSQRGMGPRWGHQPDFTCTIQNCLPGRPPTTRHFVLAPKTWLTITWLASISSTCMRLGLSGPSTSVRMRMCEWLWGVESPR